jgi:arylsulfatase A-like enzyme
MMTGLHQCVHGMTGSVGRPFPPGLRPLASRLRDAGYATAAITEGGFLDAAAFVRGFGYYWETRDGDDRVRRTVAQAERWLHDDATEPFFLFVHTYQTHEPYFAAAPYDTMFAEVDGGGAVAAAEAASDQHLLTKYDAAVRYTDASIAPLLDTLRARPGGSRTLLVITSDHGEAFGEHGYTGHGRTLHEEVLRVPLLVWAPGLVAAGRRVPGLVGVIDVAPTILDLLGLPVPGGLTGVSLAPQLHPGETPPLPERILFSENTLHNIYRLSPRAAWKAMYE